MVVNKIRSSYHPESHAALLAQTALVGYLHEFFGEVNLFRARARIYKENQKKVHQVHQA